MQEFLIMGFQKQFIFPCFLFISTLSHLFLSSSQVGGVFRRNRTLFFVSNELFVLPFIFYVTQSVSVVCGYKSERAGVRAPEIKKILRINIFCVPPLTKNRQEEDTWLQVWSLLYPTSSKRTILYFLYFLLWHLA